MKKIPVLLFAICVSSMLFAQPKSAEEMIDKYVEAIGGRELILGLKSQVIEADLTVMGTSLSSTTTVLVGKGFKNVADFDGQTIIQSITPTGGWMINPLAGQSEAVDIPADQYEMAKSAMYIGGELLYYKERGYKATLDGTENISGTNAIKLKLKAEGKNNRTYYFDPATNYLLRAETELKVNGTDMTSKIDYSNYKKTEIGYIMPFTTVTNQGFEIASEVSKVEFNKTIDEAIFKKPGT